MGAKWRSVTGPEGRSFRRAFAFFLAAGSFALAIAAAHADYTDGLIADQKIGRETAIRIWRRAAWQDDDFLSQIRLGDLYAKEGDNKYYDPVEAYVWYYLAAQSLRLNQYIGDNYARRVVSNDFNRAVWHLNRLMLLMNADQREEARNRIVYILSCRGSEGFIRLGELYTTEDSDDAGDDPPPPPSHPPHGPPVPAGHPPYGAAAGPPPGRGPYGGGDYGDDYPNDNPDIYNGMSDWYQAQNGFHHRADRIYDHDNSGAQQIMGIDTDSVIVPNDGEALVFFHVADNMGHPLAGAYLRSLDRDVRSAGGIGARVADDAEEKAHWWYPPFEFYPLGDNASGVPYTDECYLNLSRLTELAVVPATVPVHAVQQALWFLGWITTPALRWGNALGPVELRGISQFQTTLGDQATGHLTPLETVRLIQTAAIRGDSSSQNTLGVMYAKGIGVDRNFVRAEYWFQKSADQRNGAALYHLAILYKVGPLGIKQDVSKSNDYMTQSALAGFRPTLNHLQMLLTQADIDSHMAPRRGGPP